MNRNQIIVIAFCAALGLGIYLFADTKKPKEEKPADSGHNTMPQQMQQPEALNIETYLAEVNSKITDKVVQGNLEKLIQSNSYEQLSPPPRSDSALPSSGHWANCAIPGPWMLFSPCSEKTAGRPTRSG